jgi:prepilin-type N-terminal cleavage/methylation domain-containing protein
MKNKGFTLIELMVAMSVFVLIIASSSGLFVSGLKIQRGSIAYQQLLDQMSYFTEYMSRAVRMAKKDISGDCTGAVKLNYSFADQCLNFRNYKDQCQQFCLEGERLKDENGNYLTSDDLRILSFSVVLLGQTQDDNQQPKAVIIIEARGKEDSKITIQTTISQRNLDVRK